MKDCPNHISPLEARTFQDSVLSIVSLIPRGRVTSYGTIATLAGWPDHARMVGHILHYTPEAAKLPCHRVVNAAGRTAPGWLQHRSLLEAEGVRFLPNGHVDMKEHLWMLE